MTEDMTNKPSETIADEPIVSAPETPEGAPAETPSGVPNVPNEEPFDAPVRGVPIAGADDDAEALLINLEGYEGPLDVLLELARKQKVDLRKISMLALVDQYLAFVEKAKTKRLELAADYLVMAAWLAYLKSKLLLPVVEADGEEPTADEMAALLAFQLQRLEAMRKATKALFDAPQAGIDFMPRGAGERVRIVRRTEWTADLYDLLQAYARQRVATIDRHYKIDPPKVFSIEDARKRLARILGDIPDWIDLRSLTNESDIDAPKASVVASAFNAALEFAKHGKIDLRQLAHYEPIYIRKRGDMAISSDTAENDAQQGEADLADQHKQQETA